MLRHTQSSYSISSYLGITVSSTGDGHYLEKNLLNWIYQPFNYDDRPVRLVLVDVWTKTGIIFSLATDQRT